jgi:membrane protease YdiL (CAAX protease family)
VFISLIKCAGYYGVYYLLNIVVTVALILVMAVIKPNADAEATLNSVVIPLTLLCNALFLLGTAMFYNRKGSYVSFADRVQVYPFNSRLLPFIVCLGITAMFTVNIILNLIPFPESWQEMLSENSDMISSSSMLMQIVCVGLIGPIAEEVIFRGLLFRAMEKDNVKSAIIVSALTFGIGHIVNLLNGSGRELLSSLGQIIFAVLVGFVLVLIFYHGKSLTACILFHSANNALKVFAGGGSLSPQTEMIMNLVISVVVLGGYLFYLVKVLPIGEEHLS